MKKVLAIVLAALIVACAAASAQTALRAIAEYEGFGLVELDLNRNVSWLEPLVTVTDANGNTFEAQVLKYDRDDVNFWVPNLAEDQLCTGAVSGTENGETVSFEFYASSQVSSMIRKVEYDAEDRELDIEFTMNVEYRNPSVTVTDASGAQYETRILERDNDSLDVRVKGLNRGDSYTVSVSGVRGQTFETFETCSLDFVAWDD